ncbi:sensor histidine kinase [Desulfosarcina ovata]|uniref:histidine kinase n=1 Tax=Desulfosarcina ovata subsp. ovata TaxID=2752305 RepID=A0A5K8ADW9_9BACT|nr:ATP-binding protein [Desulfosarcina ovata]BBO90815.1 two-component sensor histidine kinase [Desulfosarcina ovata subsp. ovata]
MKPLNTAERVKPFRLVKYFTFTSLIVIFIGTIILSVLNTHWVRSMQYQKSEDYALLLIENLNHQVFLQFILPVGLKYGKIELRHKEQFERMDNVVRSTLHSFKVEMVNIYSKDDIIAYSFSEDLVGKQNLGGTSFSGAIDGKASSKLVQNGTFWEILLGIPKKIKIITFAPLRAEKPLSPISGPVLGVIEIRQDLSSDYQQIFKYQVLVICTISIVMGILLLTLIFVVKRGEGIIEKRALERIRLKDQLAKAKHLSSLGEMIAGVSHEIRNPLGIISSSAELLKKKMGPREPLNGIADIIVTEARRLNNIITDFLNYARPKAPNRSTCHINDVLDKNILFLDQQIKDKGYVIKTVFDNHHPCILADSDMLYQAFLNLLINAMQAMPDGGAIMITTHAEEDALWLYIEDEGDGVSPAVMEKIWDPFFTTKEKGTGLGLGIVKNIIEANDGMIRIDNRREKGARVTVKFPLDQEAQ